jgi:hypothetical protein
MRGVTRPQVQCAVALALATAASAGIAARQSASPQVTSPQVTSPQASQQASAGRILLATVVDSTGKPQVDLAADDFVIEEGGEERDVLDVHVADYPVAVLVDDASEASALGVIKTSVARFISRIGERPVALGLLSNPAEMIASLDDDRAEVLARAAAMTLGAGTPMTLPAVAHAAQLLQATGSPFSAIVIVTDRAIDARTPVEGDLLPTILQSGAAVHVIEMGPTMNTTDGLLDVPDLLRVLADQTHGQFTSIFSSASFPSALDRLADRLSAEMMVEYLVPPNTTAGDVRVGVRRPGSRVLGAGVK